jgi:hypothetical protein
MPITAIEQQRRLRELGRIRTGDRSEKGAPRKLTSFRITSPSRAIVERVAELYGGEAREWRGAPDEGTWEVYTTAPSIPVMVPPGQTLTQWYELWSGGGCQRRCDGQYEQLGDTPCLCPPDQEERREQAQDGRACKPTTRLSVMLPDVPDIGMFRLESHGYYAAVEMAGIMAVLERATRTGALVPARLRIEQRSRKHNGGTLRYIVPVLELPDITPMQLARGYGLLPSGMDTEAPALSAPAVQTLPEPPPATEPADPALEWVARFRACETQAQANDTYRQLPAGLRTHEAIRAAMAERKAAFAAAQQQAVEA